MENFRDYSYDDKNGDYETVICQYEVRDDAVTHPKHYCSHPSGIECIEITQHMNFCLGNVVKYIWRADLKHDDNGTEDLRKALFYLQQEIQRRDVNELYEEFASEIQDLEDQERNTSDLACARRATDGNRVENLSTEETDPPFDGRGCA